MQRQPEEGPAAWGVVHVTAQKGRQGVEAVRWRLSEMYMLKREGGRAAWESRTHSCTQAGVQAGGGVAERRLRSARPSHEQRPTVSSKATQLHGSTHRWFRLSWRGQQKASDLNKNNNQKSSPVVQALVAHVAAQDAAVGGQPRDGNAHVVVNLEDLQRGSDGACAGSKMLGCQEAAAGHGRAPPMWSLILKTWKGEKQKEAGKHGRQQAPASPATARPAWLSILKACMACREGVARVCMWPSSSKTCIYVGQHDMASRASGAGLLHCTGQQGTAATCLALVERQPAWRC